MTETYLDMMETSLIKKIEVMKQIEAQNIRQKEALVMEDGFDEETFDDAVRIKTGLIDRLTELNEGFAGLYDKVKDDINADKPRYRAQVEHMQDLIRTVTDISNTIEIQETRNKEIADNIYSGIYSGLKKNGNNGIRQGIDNEVGQGIDREVWQGINREVRQSIDREVRKGIDKEERQSIDKSVLQGLDKEARQNAAVAFSYHSAMTKSSNIQPRFFDDHG
ncbi:hypothetical protein SAMN04487884_12756 [Butyrivibrio fibrisolvens]|uniref:Uncharacterized protein n=1 Tax=Butyrivibrio fibrisolvens TaxID=831 RepID=A0A1H9W711_BUTFI|nr:hypothetical protein [Butyrivibrio fibrisolvens]SES29559.1 hypothetical protein SAMN04487884_12756 [Butyrivibrio fibrisolvens]